MAEKCDHVLVLVSEDDKKTVYRCVKCGELVVVRKD